MGRVLSLHNVCETERARGRGEQAREHMILSFFLFFYKPTCLSQPLTVGVEPHLLLLLLLPLLLITSGSGLHLPKSWQLSLHF